MIDHPIHKHTHTHTKKKKKERKKKNTYYIFYIKVFIS